MATIVLSMRLLPTSLNANVQAFVQSPVRAEGVQTQFRAYPDDPDRGHLSCESGGLSLGLGTYHVESDILVNCHTCTDILVENRRMVLSLCPALSHTLPLVLSNHRSCAGVMEKPLAWALQMRGSKKWHGPWFSRRGLCTDAL